MLRKSSNKTFPAQTMHCHILLVSYFDRNFGIRSTNRIDLNIEKCSNTQAFSYTYDMHSDLKKKNLSIISNLPRHKKLSSDISLIIGRCERVLSKRYLSYLFTMAGSDIVLLL